MDTPTILRFFFALVLVLIMMGGLGLILKYVSNSRVIRGNGTKRLSVTETLSIDHKRRAVILQCDEKEHLVILGANSETVVETRSINSENVDKTKTKKAKAAK
ncbi:MAG: hypothetical protein CMH28_07970 [Micavibrio sp.]|mgnify:CR=1 FL=1|nr:hypothetical protein [Micavibrio sp.]|tara:strand:+ start:246 stop:554 length:309 start_codon:yes stop_codon:yes gene_type:complete